MESELRTSILAGTRPRSAALAAKHSADARLVVAALDATANDVVGHAVASFPTRKLFPAGTSDGPVTYLGGERTVEALEEFLSANGHEFSAAEATRAEL